MSAWFKRLYRGRLSKRMANRVYDILVEVCGALEAQRDRFVAYQTERADGQCSEWRFQGRLGFGGKFWRQHGRLYVNYGSEDASDEKMSICNEANHRLGKL